MKNILNNGGPAFPHTINDGEVHEHTGMSLLDHFASHEVTQPPQHFMQAELGNGLAKTLGPKGQPIKTGPASAEDLAAMLAKWRYICASAMLNERQRRMG